MQVFGKYKRALGGARRAYAPLLTGKCYQDRMVAFFAPRSPGTVGQNAAVEIPIKGFPYAVTKNAVALLKPLLPGVTEIVSMVEDNSI